MKIRLYPQYGSASVTFGRPGRTRKIKLAGLHGGVGGTCAVVPQILGRRRRGRPPSSSGVFRFLVALAGIILLAPTLPPVFAQSIPPGGGGTDWSTKVPKGPGNGNDYEGPVGVAGIFNGNITTACSYDPLTQSAKRTITDLVVPGSVGKYPLKMTRYYDSRAQYYAFGIGLSPSWEHEYGYLLWSGGHKVVSPDGSTYDDFCGLPVGVSERWEQRTDPYNGTFRLADGGKVIFQYGSAVAIEDPYGQRTTIAHDTYNNVTRVT